MTSFKAADVIKAVLRTAHIQNVCSTLKHLSDCVYVAATEDRSVKSVRDGQNSFHSLSENQIWLRVSEAAAPEETLTYSGLTEQLGCGRHAAIHFCRLQQGQWDAAQQG